MTGLELARRAGVSPPTFADRARGEIPSEESRPDRARARRSAEDVYGSGRAAGNGRAGPARRAAIAPSRPATADRPPVRSTRRAGPTAPPRTRRPPGGRGPRAVRVRGATASRRDGRRCLGVPSWRGCGASTTRRRAGPGRGALAVDARMLDRVSARGCGAAVNDTTARGPLLAASGDGRGHRSPPATFDRRCCTPSAWRDLAAGRGSVGRVLAGASRPVAAGSRGSCAARLEDLAGSPRHDRSVVAGLAA